MDQLSTIHLADSANIWASFTPPQPHTTLKVMELPSVGLELKMLLKKMSAKGLSLSKLILQLNNME